ncbi:MAG: alpha-isopropylmalate synthase regulatory domain-containing protein [Victivallaceae bacterium]|nr:alpha-isopropylmalate synthase regulatory domain-containing protein [Victivallaceae bacterium]
MAQPQTDWVEVLDTTLRDGEQTPGVAFTPAEKLEIARLLIGKLGVDRLEIGSARVSEGESEGVSAILRWAKENHCEERIELLGFVDGGKSVDWIAATGGKVINLLTKGSLRHCNIQLRKSPEEHFNDVAREIAYAIGKGLSVNVYLEDWSNGEIDSPEYVRDYLDFLSKLPVQRVMLPDTLGVATPRFIGEKIAAIRLAHPEMKLDFHGHNDYGLVTANSLAAVESGVSGVHTTINGLGERTGNQPLAQLVVTVNDLSSRCTRIVEKELLRATGMVQSLSGKRCAWNAPVVGSDVFTQTCGVHADGDKKGNLYANNLLPERFGRHRDYALGKLSGKASLDKNLEELGMDLPVAVRSQVLAEIVRLGDKKKTVTQSDLPFIIANVLRTPLASHIKILDYKIITSATATPQAEVSLRYNDQTISGTSGGDGGYDAFVKALRKMFKELGIGMPTLADYEVRIPPGGKTDALVETTISWNLPGGKILVTKGVDSDQLVAAVTATEKMLNLTIP